MIDKNFLLVQKNCLIDHYEFLKSYINYQTNKIVKNFEKGMDQYNQIKCLIRDVTIHYPHIISFLLNSDQNTEKNLCSELIQTGGTKNINDSREIIENVRSMFHIIRLIDINKVADIGNKMLNILYDVDKKLDEIKFENHNHLENINEKKMIQNNMKRIKLSLDILINGSETTKKNLYHLKKNKVDNKELKHENDISVEACIQSYMIPEFDYVIESMRLFMESNEQQDIAANYVFGKLCNEYKYHDKNYELILDMYNKIIQKKHIDELNVFMAERYRKKIFNVLSEHINMEKYKDVIIVDEKTAKKFINQYNIFMYPKRKNNLNLYLPKNIKIIPYVFESKNNENKDKQLLNTLDKTAESVNNNLFKHINKQKLDNLQMLYDFMTNLSHGNSIENNIRKNIERDVYTYTLHLIIIGTNQIYTKNKIIYLNKQDINQYILNIEHILKSESNSDLLVNQMIIYVNKNHGIIIRSLLIFLKKILSIINDENENVDIDVKNIDETIPEIKINIILLNYFKPIIDYFTE